MQRQLFPAGDVLQGIPNHRLEANGGAAAVDDDIVHHER